MKRRISALAKVVRSKNSGPFELTFDVIFGSQPRYDKAKKMNLINQRLICSTYSLAEKSILNIIYFDPARAVKVTVARPVPSGSMGDTDVYGSQQHMPLANAEVEWD